MNAVLGPPVLNRLQHAWLLEIGMDARLLGRYATVGAERALPDAPPGEAAAGAPVSGRLAAAPAIATAPPAASEDTVPVSNSEPLRKQPTPLASMRSALLAGKPLRGPVERSAPEPAAGTAAAGASIIDVSGVHDMDSLRALVSSCQACALHEGRSRVVFGSGAIQRPRLLIVGEAPGDHDDRMGEPFQGPAGKLLHAMLGAVGIDPAGSVFYTNTLKCRPLASRPAQAPEEQSCRPYLSRQIDLLQPRFVLALGRMAALALLGGDDSLDALRARVHQFHTADGLAVGLVATHHPASLLLRARQKAEVWADLNLMRKALPDD